MPPGALAQLVAHLLCKQGVRGSSPLGSTKRNRISLRFPSFLGLSPCQLGVRGGGLVGEGFTTPNRSSPQPSAPSVKLGSVTLRQINVVGAVIVREGRVLCAQRGPAGGLGGMWEFHGGKIEPGEDAKGTLKREIDEELLCQVVVGDEVTTTTYDFRPEALG